MRRFNIVPLAALAVSLAACGDSTSPRGNTNKAVDVFTVNVAFSPATVQIAPGDTVRFNIVPAADGDGHDVTFDAANGVPKSIPVTRDSIVARVFNTRGDFKYNCFVHPGMSGDVVVQ